MATKGKSFDLDGNEESGDKYLGEFRSGGDVQTALIRGRRFAAKPVQYAVIDGLAIVEGDIVLGTEEEVRRETEQLREELSQGVVARGAVLPGAQFHWTNCRVPYMIDAALPNQARVTDAIAHWEANTHYRFVLRTAANQASHPDWVTFRPASGCSAAVGRRGGQQFVNLGPNCTLGNCIHEIGHAIGLWHEQSREDRDAFVTIHWANIQAGMEHNFNQHISDGDDVGPYDYGSIMHYPRDAFSKNGNDTIVPTTAGAAIGQRNGLSAGDIAAANSLCTPPPKRPLDDVTTLKEQIKDLRLDTRKELVADTRKEAVLDTRKEQVLDTVKEGTLDPGPVTLAENVTLPGQPGRPAVNPAAGGGLQPFAMRTPQPADRSGDPGNEAASVVGRLDQDLQALSEQLVQLEVQRQMIQAQYDETAAMLQRTLDEHDPV